MRLYITVLVILSGLLLSLTPPAPAAPKKARPAPKVSDSDSEDIPQQSWSLTATGFIELFKLRNKEIEAAEPNRYFPGSVAFALGRIDESGNFLMLRCRTGASSCGSKRNVLEERIVSATLLEAVRTKAPKDQLYDKRTWALTPLGEKYMEKLRKRYPDLSTRLARLVAAALADK